MNNNVFGAIMAVVALGWVGLYFFMVSPVKTEAAEKSEEVATNEKRLRKYIKMGTEELPTKKKLDWVQEGADLHDTAYKDLLEEHKDRARRFGYFWGQESISRGDWEARYRDQYSELEKRYRGMVEMAEDQEIPFSAERSPLDDNIPVEVYHKRWRAQEALVSNALDRGAQIRSYKIDKPRKTKKKKSTSGNKKKSKAKQEYFARTSVDLELLFPPSKLNDYIGGLLEHADIQFEIETIEVVKQRKDLVAGMVREVDRDSGEAKDTLPGTEPLVGVALTVSYLDWAYEEEAPPAKEEEE